MLEGNNIWMWTKLKISHWWSDLWPIPCRLPCVPSGMTSPWGWRWRSWTQTLSCPVKSTGSLRSSRLQVCTSCLFCQCLFEQAIPAWNYLFLWLWIWAVVTFSFYSYLRFSPGSTMGLFFFFSMSWPPALFISYMHACAAIHILANGLEQRPWGQPEHVNLSFWLLKLHRKC